MDLYFVITLITIIISDEIFHLYKVLFYIETESFHTLEQKSDIAIDARQFHCWMYFQIVLPFFSIRMYQI